MIFSDTIYNIFNVIHFSVVIFYLFVSVDFLIIWKVFYFMNVDCWFFSFSEIFFCYEKVTDYSSRCIYRIFCTACLWLRKIMCKLWSMLICWFKKLIDAGSQKCSELSNKKLSGVKSALQEKRWAYVHLIRGAANHPIICLQPTFGLQQFFHRHITSNNITFGLPSDYRKLSHLQIISIHTKYGLPAEKSL